MKKNTKATIEDIRTIIFDNLNNFQKYCHIIADKWETKTLPLNAIKTGLDKIKWDLKKAPTKEIKKFQKQYNDMIDNTYNTLDQIAKDYETRKVPLSLIEAVKLIKTNFDTGLKK